MVGHRWFNKQKLILWHIARCGHNFGDKCYDESRFDLNARSHTAWHNRNCIAHQMWERLFTPIVNKYGVPLTMANIFFWGCSVHKQYVRLMCVRHHLKYKYWRLCQDSLQQNDMLFAYKVQRSTFTWFGVFIRLISISCVNQMTVNNVVVLCCVVNWCSETILKMRFNDNKKCKNLLIHSQMQHWPYNIGRLLHFRNHHQIDYKWFLAKIVWHNNSMRILSLAQDRANSQQDTRRQCDRPTQQRQ